MPETRKYEPGEVDPVQAAIRAALGEQVRPTEPGARPQPAASAPEPGQQAGPKLTTVGSFTFTSVPKPRPVADEDEDEELDEA